MSETPLIRTITSNDPAWRDRSLDEACRDAACRFVVVPRLRGQQLKEQAQLDSWLRDGSAAYVDGLCLWE